jgi:hypothetical protein
MKNNKTIASTINIMRLEEKNNQNQDAHKKKSILCLHLNNKDLPQALVLYKLYPLGFCIFCLQRKGRKCEHGERKLKNEGKSRTAKKGRKVSNV